LGLEGGFIHRKKGIFQVSKGINVIIEHCGDSLKERVCKIEKGKNRDEKSMYGTKEMQSKKYRRKS
jgi:hypothetical protein